MNKMELFEDSRVKKLDNLLAKKNRELQRYDKKVHDTVLFIESIMYHLPPVAKQEAHRFLLWLQDEG
jgi:hypothetical protein